MIDFSAGVCRFYVSGFFLKCCHAFVNYRHLQIAWGIRRGVLILFWEFLGWIVLKLPDLNNWNILFELSRTSEWLNIFLNTFPIIKTILQVCLRIHSFLSFKVKECFWDCWNWLRDLIRGTWELISFWDIGYCLNVGYSCYFIFLLIMNECFSYSDRLSTEVPYIFRRRNLFSGEVVVGWIVCSYTHAVTSNSGNDKFMIFRISFLITLWWEFIF